MSIQTAKCLECEGRGYFPAMPELRLKELQCETCEGTGESIEQASVTPDSLFNIVGEITGELAVRLAESQNLPYKNPTFLVTMEGNEIWLGYDAGLDYNEDGYTHEQEWKLWPPDSLLDRSHS